MKTTEDILISFLNKLVKTLPKCIECGRLAVYHGHIVLPNKGNWNPRKKGMASQ